LGVPVLIGAVMAVRGVVPTITEPVMRLVVLVVLAVGLPVPGVPVAMVALVVLVLPATRLRSRGLALGKAVWVALAGMGRLSAAMVVPVGLPGPARGRRSGVPAVWRVPG
jgi:hypothetical protein